jgi:hypothetical protein
MTVQSEAVVRRKPRITGYQKKFRKFFRSAKQYILPTVRYGTITSITITITITNIITTSTIKLLILILILMIITTNNKLILIYKKGTMPLILFISIKYTEPSPTILEMLNPFF